MPRKAINYKKVYVYKIVCNDTNIKDCYVGHTTNFNNRKHIHKSDYTNNPQRKLYKFIREHGGWENWSMILIETCDFGEEGNELLARQKEREWQENLNATLNNNNILFENFQGETERFDDVDDKVEKNVLMNSYRNKTERKELLFLRIKRKELESENDRLNQLNTELKTENDRLNELLNLKTENDRLKIMLHHYDIIKSI